MGNWSVYRHTSPSGNIYIGITSKTPEHRWRNGEGYKNCVVFYKAVKKYGWDNIKHEVLFTNLIEEKAKHLEIELIRHYKRLGISYNITDGGDGALGRIVSEETRAKQRAAKLGKPLSEEHIAKIRANAAKMKGVPRSEEFKRKLHEINKGKKPSPQTYVALIEYNRTHPISEETRRKMLETKRKTGYKSQIEILNKNRKEIGIKHRKPVVQLNTAGSLINTYEGEKFAEVETGIAARSIAACCKGKAFKAGGYLWMYLSDYNKYLSEGRLKEYLMPIIHKATMPSGCYERTEEWRKRRSEAQKGVEKRSKATIELMKQRAIKALSKPVVQMTIDNTPIAIYSNGAQIQKKYGFLSSYIGSCCNGKRKTAYGYKWKYITKEEYEEYKKTLEAA